MKKALLKGSLLLGSVFLLAACNSDEAKDTASDAESAAESVASEVTSEDSSSDSESEESEESLEESEESSEESEESSEESEELSEESEESSEESEESSEESEESAGAAVVSDESAELQDGTYTAVSDVDEHGWSLQFTIEVKDGKIESSDFDYVNEEGDLKSEDEEYNKNMEANGSSFADAKEDLDNQLVDKQSAEEIDVVSGATNSTEVFEKAAKALIEAAQEGNTEEINIDELEDESASSDESESVSSDESSEEESSAE